MPARPLRVVPGNKTYAQATAGSRQNVLIIADSTLKRMDRRSVFSGVHDSYIKIKCHPGATPRRLHHYLLYDLEESKNDIVMVHVGTNSIMGKESAETIADDIYNVALTCRAHGVKKVIISGITMRWDGSRIEQKRKAINHILKESCDLADDFIYMDNDNIDLNDVENKKWDHVHLTREGEGNIKLAYNIVRTLNAI